MNTRFPAKLQVNTFVPTRPERRAGFDRLGALAAAILVSTAVGTAWGILRLVVWAVR